MVEITIIIGVYNGERFLPELLDSIVAQSFGLWQCIVVDDGSSDSSSRILADAARRDGRFRVIRQENAGVGAARNAALALVDTPYVMFADQDDRLEPMAVERAVAAIEASGCDILHFRSNRNLKSSIFVWEHIFRTAAIGDTRFEPITGGEDTAFFWELSFKKLRRAAIDDVLYFNRPNCGSFSRDVSPRYIDNTFAAYRAMRKTARRNSMGSLRLWWRLVWHIAPFAASVMLRHPSKANCMALCRNLWRMLPWE